MRVHLLSQNRHQSLHPRWLPRAPGGHRSVIRADAGALFPAARVYKRRAQSAPESGYRDNNNTINNSNSNSNNNQISSICNDEKSE